MPIIAPIPRNERRQMEKIVHKTTDKNHSRRLMAMLMLHRGESLSYVAKNLCAARSSVGLDSLVHTIWHRRPEKSSARTPKKVAC